MLPDEHYICQSAANAIISQVGPLRISSDALQVVNQFLDEFIQLLVIQLEDSSSSIIGLSKLKQACFQLLPNILGKNAIVEAELEVKNRTTIVEEPESSSFGHDLPFIRKKCLEHCTLADKTKNNSNTEQDSVVGVVVVYVTTILEHVGEYLLTCIATTADDQQDTEYVRVKDVFFALMEDAQLSLLFGRMDLHDKIEKRVGRSISINNSRPRSCYLPMTSTIQNNRRYTTIKRNSVVEINFDDLELEYFEEDNDNNSKRYTAPQVSQTNNQQQQQQKRPFIKKRTTPRVQSVYAPDKPNMNFEDLIKSNSTVKVSLTPNRLKSIEVKDHRKEDDNESWLRRRSSTTLASIKRLASNIRPISSPVKLVGKKEEDDDDDESKETIRKKGEEQGSIKRSASTPPIHHHHQHHRKKENKPLQRSQSPLSISSSIVEMTTSSSSSSLDNDSNIPINATTTTIITENNNTSHMSIPSLSLSDISKSHYSTSSLASTLSSTSVLKELSSSSSIEKGEERKSCAIISSPPSTLPSIDSNISKLKEQQQYLLDNKKISFENKQEEEINHLQQPSLPEQQQQEEEESLQTITINQQQQQQPERPSSIVARRAYRLGNSRPKSFHESQATEKYSTLFHKESINRDDDKEKADTTERTSNLVLDKVLKFELASTYEPSKKGGERFLYLQPKPNSTSLQKKRTSDFQKCPVDQAVQTVQTVTEVVEEEEIGVIDGDEEWFIKDDELDEQDEADIVNWLLGE